MAEDSNLGKTCSVFGWNTNGIMDSVLEAFREEITRRRALWITPFAFAGLVAISSSKGNRTEDNVADGSTSEVVIVPFTNKGEKLAPVNVKKLIRSNAQWRKLLDAEEYYVTRQQGTDTAFTGTYYQLHEAGLFRCICCGNALFGSDAKFDSGTGWPSFTAPIAEENIYTRKDVSLFLERVEVDASGAMHISGTCSWMGPSRPTCVTASTNPRCGSFDTRGECGVLALHSIREACMNRLVALKIVLALVGVLFLALAYPLVLFVRQDPATSMMFSLYVTLGVFLLLAVRNPMANRSLIAFTAWSSFAHAAVMGTQALRNMISRGELVGVAVLIVIGIVLLALAPGGQPATAASRSSRIYQAG